MKDCFRKPLLILKSVLFVITALTVVRCTKVDDTLGSDLIPGDQIMSVGIDTLKNRIRSYVTFTDSLPSNNNGTGYWGKTTIPGFDRMTAGTLMQFLPVTYTDTTGNFGYGITYDSITFLTKFSYIGGDTLKPQTFNIYEITSDLIPDTTYYTGFDYTDKYDPEPILSFTLSGIYKSTSYYDTLRLSAPTPKTIEFFQRLLEADVETYDVDTLFYDSFKGLFVMPAAESPADAAIYGAALANTQIMLFSHNYTDATLSTVKDTLTFTYSFNDNLSYSKMVSVGIVEHDFSISDFESIINDTIRPAAITYVEGMGGVTTQLEFESDIFDYVRALKASYGDNAELMINKAEIIVWLEDEDYVSFDEAPARLGSYTDYSSLTPIIDYYYTLENSSTTLAYGGYLNRSHGCYKMDITSTFQHALLNDGQIKRITLAPQAYGLYDTSHVRLKGYDSDKPLELVLTYTVIR